MPTQPLPPRIPDDRRPARLGPGIAVFAALAAAMPGVMTGLRTTPDLLGRGLLNPDSAMRLVRLEDIVESHAPLHAVMRDGSGAGTVLAWSHLLDSLLLLLAAPLTLWMGWPEALHWAALAFGPLSMAALGVAIAWAALPAIDRAWVWVGAFAAGAAPSLGGYGMLGEVHHHVPAALAVVMAAGWTVRIIHSERAGGGLALGAWIAAGLWFTPEAAVFAILAWGGLWAAWLTGPRASRTRVAGALLASAGSLLALTTLAWLVDPPPGGLAAAEPDRLSVAWVALAAGAFVTAWVARGVGRPLPALATGLGLGLLWLAAFPHFLRGTEGLMTAAEAEAFFGPIVEMQPVRTVSGVVENLTGGLFAAASLAMLAWRHRRAGSGGCGAPLAYAALCAALTIGMAATHVRFGTYPALAGAVMLPVALTAISASGLPTVVQSFARLALIALLIGASHAGPVIAAAEARPASGATARTGTAMPCKVGDAARLLADHAGEVVLAGVNETPDLLYRSRIRTVGSLYHRNPAGYMRLRAAWRSIPGDTAGPPPELRATGATLVLGCAGEPRWLIVDGLPKTTLLDRLVAQDPPAWLRRIADAGPGGYVLYEIAD